LVSIAIDICAPVIVCPAFVEFLVVANGLVVELEEDLAKQLKQNED